MGEILSKIISYFEKVQIKPIFFLQNTYSPTVCICKMFFKTVIYFHEICETWVLKKNEASAFTRLAFLHLSKHEKFVAFQKVTTLSSSKVK